MGIENWAKSPGLPPQYIDVLWREPLDTEYCKDYEEAVVVRGNRPDLGILHKGWSGDETVVFRQKRYGNWRVINPMQPQGYINALPFEICA